MSENAVLLWFRQDLRLSDNPALLAACQSGVPVVPFFLWDPLAGGDWRLGGASKVWLHASLNALDQSLKKYGSQLLIRAVGEGHTSATNILKSQKMHSKKAPTTPEKNAASKTYNDDYQHEATLASMRALAQAAGASTIHANARYEPWAQAQQKVVQKALQDVGITLVLHNQGALLWEPEEIQTGSGGPYQVFTPYFKRCLAQIPDFTPQEAPVKIPAPEKWPTSLPIEALHLLPKMNWGAEIGAFWQPGEAAAQATLHRFIADALSSYAKGRDIPGIDGTSRLSPHLCFGEISPRQIWAALSECTKNIGQQTFLKEIVWREFAYHVLHHFQHLPECNLKSQFDGMSWQADTARFTAWTQGQTGYPIVDAGMRQLWQIGWMHNRVRMIVGSFFTKHLMLPWQEGARWFWDTLVDADLANNSFNWQWIAGCGADAAPFFRIFNPVTQGEKFDAHGDYIRRWVPELSRLPNQWIHHPWDASPAILRDAGITLGETYPEPIVSHAEAREIALAAYKKLR